MFAIDSDVLNPRSAELTRAFDLETYDRAIMSPVADQEALYKGLLMGSNPKTARDPDAYMTKQAPAAPAGASSPGSLGAPGPGIPATPPKTGSLAKPNAPIVDKLAPSTK